MNKIFHFQGSHFDHIGIIPYSKEIGYGFMTKTSMHKRRSLRVDLLKQDESGIVFFPCEELSYYKNANDYDYGGLSFRIDLSKIGPVHIEVTITSAFEDTNVSVSGMNPTYLSMTAPWDSARLISRKHYAYFKGQTWCYDYYSGNGFVEIEVESRDGKQSVGIAMIKITDIDTSFSPTKPTICLLGDSTVKSYIYEEAIMSGWGQIFDDLFCLDQVNILNYSMGGRSLSTLYREGRLNEILLESHAGDYLFLQSGHNDESVGDLNGPTARFGRGNTKDTFLNWLNNFFLPAARHKGLNVILITPMTRIDTELDLLDSVCFRGFINSSVPHIDFPQLIKDTAKKWNLPCVDLYEESKKYLSEIGSLASRAIFLSVEAGETPGKTNTGSYANGNPGNKCDGTHYKEALAKQFAYIVAKELWKQNLLPLNYYKEVTRTSFRENNIRIVFPEISNDVIHGPNAYYRNQIETLIKRGYLSQDELGNFHPFDEMNTEEFIEALELMWKITIKKKDLYEYEQPNSHINLPTLTREFMATIIYDAYLARFGKNSDGTYQKPDYMTKYNGTYVPFDDPNYDSNLIGDRAIYYPLVPWEALSDTNEITANYYFACQECYKLGLMRSESGIKRGQMINGTKFEPKVIVTREKAAKTLYFLMVLNYDIHMESDKF